MTFEAALCVVIGIATTRSWDAEARDSEMGWGQAEDKTSFSLKDKRTLAGPTKSVLAC